MDGRMNRKNISMDTLWMVFVLSTNDLYFTRILFIKQQRLMGCPCFIHTLSMHALQTHSQNEADYLSKG